MAAICGKDTVPELIIRRGLHAKGFRYRLHGRALPGKPDMVFAQYRAVVFVHGCFWHGHDCPLFKWPRSREEFWRKKIGGNQARDARNQSALRSAGWRVATVWECALKGRGRLQISDVTEALATWLRSGAGSLCVQGDWHD